GGQPHPWAAQPAGREHRAAARRRRRTALLSRRHGRRPVVAHWRGFFASGARTIFFAAGATTSPSSCRHVRGRRGRSRTRGDTTMHASPRFYLSLAATALVGLLMAQCDPQAPPPTKTEMPTASGTPDAGTRSPTGTTTTTHGNGGQGASCT